MPPATSPTPGVAKLNEFRTWLAGSLDRSAAVAQNPGRYVVHRLNRTEYANAIRDLLALDVDVTDLLPSDGGDFGFDNIATALKTSPLLLERYLTAAQRISTLAVGDTAMAPGHDRLLDQPRVHAERARRRSAARDARRHRGSPHLPGRRRLHAVGAAHPGVEGYAGVEGNEKPQDFRDHWSTASRCSPRRSAARRTTS